MIRINKYLSMCGVTSRRGADALVADLQVTINDVTVEKPGVLVDEGKDVVRVGGIEVRPVEASVYVVLHKSRNVMTTLHDPFKRKTVLQLLKGLEDRVYPVGRLDYDTEGVLILTNDGDLAYRLAHPKYQVRKVYEVQVKGRFKPESGDRMRSGIKLEDGQVGKAEQVSALSADARSSKLRVVMTEGRKREVKQLCRMVGHPVERLVRVDFGGMTLKGLGPGKWRLLTPSEIKQLKRLVGLL